MMVMLKVYLVVSIITATDAVSVASIEMATMQAIPMMSAITVFIALLDAPV